MSPTQRPVVRVLHSLVCFGLIPAMLLCFVAPALAQDQQSPDPLPAATAGQEYKHRFRLEEGQAAAGKLTWRVKQGTPPPGLSLSPAGDLSGAVAAEAGKKFVFEVAVRDASGAAGSMWVSLEVRAPLLIARNTSLCIASASDSPEFSDSQSVMQATTAAHTSDEGAATGPMSSSADGTRHSGHAALPAGKSSAKKLDALPPEPSPAAGAGRAAQVAPTAAQVPAEGAAPPAAQSVADLRAQVKRAKEQEEEANAAIKSGLRHQIAATQDEIEALTSALKLDDDDLIQRYRGNTDLCKKAGKESDCKSPPSDKDKKAALATALRKALPGLISEEQAAVVDLQNQLTALTGPALIKWSSPFVRAIAGTDISGVSSRPSKQQFFLDFQLTAPLRFFGKSQKARNQDALDHRLWVWFNPRITGGPQQTNAVLPTLLGSGASLSNLLSTDLKQVVQGMEFFGGLELRLNKPAYGINSDNTRISTALVLAGGLFTPFSTPSDEAFVVRNTPQLRQFFLEEFNITVDAPVVDTTVTPNVTTANDFVGLLPAERSRFFRQYYAGLRLRTYFFRGFYEKLCAKDSAAEVCPIFPGTFDILVGQNASVTAGRLRGAVLRVEAFYPLPFAPQVHLYGMMITRLKRNVNSTPFYFPIETNPPPPPLSNPLVFVQVNPPVDRDFYRFGVGIDVVQIINGIRRNSAEKDQEIENLKKKNAALEARTTP